MQQEHSYSLTWLPTPQIVWGRLYNNWFITETDRWKLWGN